MNIANILKNCPEGIELYSSVCGEVIFIRVCSNNNITVRESNGSLRYFLPDGKYTGNGECVLFPSKEQRDWNKFIPDFEDGNIIIADLGNIAIFKDYKGIDPNRMRIYCQVDARGKFVPHEMNVVCEGWRLARYSEIVAFEKKIAEAGYSWNGKELTRIPKFRAGDVITNNCFTFKIDIVDDKYYYYRISHTSGVLHKIPIEDQEDWEKTKFFKVGDVITDGNNSMKITSIEEDYYHGYNISHSNCTCTFPLNCTHKYKLYKFDPKTLKHYDKVLVRQHKNKIWYPTLVSYVSNSGSVFVLDTDHAVDQVIPYEGNTHLIEKSDDPEEHYISWQK